jgi:hypothetical protein
MQFRVSGLKLRVELEHSSSSAGEEICSKETVRPVALLFLFDNVSLAAEPKQSWQQEWEKTVQAANKEGRLNLHVGRYGTEVFLNEFRKEYPEIKVVTVNGKAPAPFFILDGIAKAMENMGHHAAKTRL